MHLQGNTMVNSVLEASEAARGDKPAPKSSSKEKKRFITAKYRERRYTRPGEVMALGDAAVHANFHDLLVHIATNRDILSTPEGTCTSNRPFFFNSRAQTYLWC